MKFTIPFTFSSIDKLRKKPILVKALIKHKKDSKLEFYLKNSEAQIRIAETNIETIRNLSCDGYDAEENKKAKERFERGISLAQQSEL